MNLSIKKIKLVGTILDIATRTILQLNKLNIQKTLSGILSWSELEYMDKEDVRISPFYVKPTFFQKL